MIQPFKCALLQKQIPHYARLQGGSSISCNQIPQYQYLHFTCFIPVENLTYIVINHQEGGDCKCI